MREQFEKLPEIANRIIESAAIYNEKLNWYECYNDNTGYNHEKFINGAWYSFQEVHKELLEHQKKIDGLINTLSERSMYDKVSGSKIIFVGEVKELLK